METTNTFFKDYQNLLMSAKKMEKSEDNPFYKSKYVPLRDILSETKRLCVENNFVFTQVGIQIDSKNYLKTELIHSTGEKITSQMPIVSKDENDPQKFGAGITYIRRYSLTALLGLEEEDDDGNFAANINTNRTIDNTAPFTNNEFEYSEVPQHTFDSRKVGDTCNNCGIGKLVQNPKTGKLFCDKKCWLTPVV